jgi:hypothetical protein
VRLGHLLSERRARLAPRHATRKSFAQDVGLNIGLLRDIETAERDTYQKPTLAAIEAAYQLAAGSIERFIADSTLDELPAREDSDPFIRLVRNVREKVPQDARIWGVPPWFVRGVAQHGYEISEVLKMVDTLEGLAEKFGYSLPELLAEAELLSGRDAVKSAALKRLKREYESIKASPFLTRGQKKDLKAEYERALKTYEEGSGDG